MAAKYKKLKLLIVLPFLLFGMLLVVSPRATFVTGLASAECEDNTTKSCLQNSCPITDKKNQTGPCSDPATTCNTDKNGKCVDFVGKYVNPAINLFTAVFGLFAVISLIIGAINYTTSEGDPQKAGKAKRRVANTVFAIVAYVFLYAFLNFLIPGGLFNK